MDVKVIEITHGSNFKFISPVNLYGCSFGDNCFVGPFVEVQKNVKIGNRVKVQSHSFICEYVEIGDDVFIGHGVVFINDKFSSGRPAGGDISKWQPTRIGNSVSIGSNATILPVSICDNVVIGAGSVVTKDITKPGKYIGNPAKKL